MTANDVPRTTRRTARAKVRPVPAIATLLTGWLALPAAAQVPSTLSTPDARWTPWLGCWALQTAATPALSNEVGNLRACVTPTHQPAAVTFLTIAGDTVALKEVLVADGARHPVDESGCRGWRRAVWSQDGERLFTTAELACANEPPRRVSGLTLLARGPVWVDVQAIETGGRESVRIRRYQPSAVPSDVAGAVLPGHPSGAPAAPPADPRPMSLEDVIEASRNASAKVVEAALTEIQAGFELDSRALFALDGAGVAADVIDLMVALSYPQHFRVDPASGSADWSTTGGWISPLDPFGTHLNPWSVSYGSYGYLSPYFAPYYFSPFGYSYWWGRSGFVAPQPTLDRQSPGEHGARAVHGLGYTRVKPRSETETSGSARRRADSGVSNPGTGSRKGGGASSGSSGGTVSTEGYSRGGSASDSGRTARPRDP